MGGLHAKSMTSQGYRATYKMADMRYYGNVMTTTRWRLYVILHLQQYSRRLNLFFVVDKSSMPSVPLFNRQWKWNSSNEVKIPTDYIRDNFQCCERNFFLENGFDFTFRFSLADDQEFDSFANRRIPVSLYLRLTWVMKSNRKETASSEQLSFKSQLVSTCHKRFHLRWRHVPVSLTAERTQISSQQALAW